MNPINKLPKVQGTKFPDTIVGLAVNDTIFVGCTNNTLYAVDDDVATEEVPALVIPTTAHTKSGALCQVNLGGASNG